MPQYQYTRRSPRPNSWKLNDLPGHRMGYLMRRDIVAEIKSTAKMWQPYCLCGARSEDWFFTLKFAERRWFDAHIVAVEKQGVLAL